MSSPVSVAFNLFANIRREGDLYLAYCPPLDVATQGKTLAEAKANIFEACELFLISCLERGTLDLALRELGWSAGHQQPIPSQAERFTIPIPFGLLPRQHECPA